MEIVRNSREMRKEHVDLCLHMKAEVIRARAKRSRDGLVGIERKRHVPATEEEERDEEEFFFSLFTAAGIRQTNEVTKKAERERRERESCLCLKESRDKASQPTLFYF